MQPIQLGVYYKVKHSGAFLYLLTNEKGGKNQLKRVLIPQDQMLSIGAESTHFKPKQNINEELAVTNKSNNNEVMPADIKTEKKSHVTRMTIKQ